MDIVFPERMAVAEEFPEKPEKRNFEVGDVVERLDDGTEWYLVSMQVGDRGIVELLMDGDYFNIVLLNGTKVQYNQRDVNRKLKKIG